MKIVTVPCLYDNFSYIIWCEETGDAAIIDPVEAQPLLLKIKELGVVLKTVFCTHHHGDHIGGLKEIVARYPSIDVIAHHTDKQRIPCITRTVDDGDTICVGQQEGKVLHTPGHTSGSVCYQYANDMFTGDTLFGGGCGRIFEGTPAQMYTSLMKITQNSAELMLYFGHEYTEANLTFARVIEPENEAIISRMDKTKNLIEQGRASSPSTLALEKETNPFLRSAQPILLEKYTKLGDVPDPLSVFTTIRKRKDNF